MQLIGSAVICTLSVAFRLAAQTFLPGTAPLKTQGDLAAEMVDGINEYLVRATAESVAKRSATRPDRERLKKSSALSIRAYRSHRWAWTLQHQGLLWWRRGKTTKYTPPTGRSS